MRDFLKIGLKFLTEKGFLLSAIIFGTSVSGTYEITIHAGKEVSLSSTSSVVHKGKGILYGITKAFWGTGKECSVDETYIKTLSRVYIVDENGKLKLGRKERITVFYDYLGINLASGNFVVINVNGGISENLKKVLESFGVSVVQSKFLKLSEKEGRVVKVKNEKQAIYQFFSLLGKIPKNEEDGIVIENALILFSEDPWEHAKKSMQGYRVVVAKDVFRTVREVLKVLGIPYEEGNLTLKEGEKAKLTKFGILAVSKKGAVILTNSFESKETLNYFSARGFNVVVLEE